MRQWGHDVISDSMKMTLESCRANDSRICFLTGAGISAESGIRTFRGKDGYWTVGSDVYTPEEMATRRVFNRSPEECWKWYLMRFLICHDAQPNEGHYSLANLEKELGSRFSLVTQNIDGLHLRAGSSDVNCYQIHGSINHMRCNMDCCSDLFPLPVACQVIHETEDFESVRHLLKCPACGALSRPHVLWFDEYYSEKFYRSDSASAAAKGSDLLVVVGTTLLTSLPAAIVEAFVESGKPVIAIDIEEGGSARLARYTPGGGFIMASSTQVLPELCSLLI